MDYLQMTAPCGLDCFNCHFYLAYQGDQEALEFCQMYNQLMGIPVEVMKCQGCRPHKGLIPLQQATLGTTEPCNAYRCSRDKGLDFCFECSDFPCDYLHPYADRADKLPHNTKVFNLCLIKRMGVDKWAQEKAAQVRQTYFHKWWTL